MSKISLTPNASGTGNFTIASPNSNTDRTLTLPDNTGTIITTASTFGGTGPAFSAYIGSPQTVTSATWTKTNFNTEEFDTGNCYNNSTYEFTPTVAGYYQVNIHITFGGTSPTGAGIGLYKNNSPYKYLSLIGPSFSNGGILQNSCLIYLNGSTDYISVYGYCSASGTVTLSGGVQQSSFQAFLARSA